MDELQQRPNPDATASVTREARPIAQEPRVIPAAKESAELAGVLLPQEFVVFGSRPHPVVFIRPAIATVIVFIAAIATLTFRVRPIIHGHHVTISFFTTPNGAIALVLVSIFSIIALSKLMKAASYYKSFRCIATNRRVFIMRGIFGRSLQPIGNAATAGAGLVQGFFGRRYDFGTIYTNFGVLRDMREPVPLYRAIHAVANGVQGDTWTAPSRHTYVP